jgi:hypothetical protein
MKMQLRCGLRRSQSASHSVDDMSSVKDAERPHGRGEDAHVKQVLSIRSMMPQGKIQAPAAKEAVEHFVSNGPIERLEVSVGKVVVEGAFAFRASEYSADHPAGSSTRTTLYWKTTCKNFCP